MTNIFISYAREDLDQARSLYRFLVTNGHTAWMDKESLLPGENWMLAIQQAIKDSDFFLACLSKHSVSKRGYVQKELKQACAVLEEFPDGEIFIIPIRLDDCEVPERFSALQYIDWGEENSRMLLLKAIASRARGDVLIENLRLLNLLASLKTRTRFLYPELYRAARDLQTQSGPVSLLESTLADINPVLEELKVKGLLEFAYAKDDGAVIDGRSGEPVRRVQFVGVDLQKLRPLLMALGEENR